MLRLPQSERPGAAFISRVAQTLPLDAAVPVTAESEAHDTELEHDISMSLIDGMDKEGLCSRLHSPGPGPDAHTWGLVRAAVRAVSGDKYSKGHSPQGGAPPSPPTTATPSPGGSRRYNGGNWKSPKKSFLGHCARTSESQMPPAQTAGSTEASSRASPQALARRCEPTFNASSALQRVPVSPVSTDTSGDPTTRAEKHRTAQAPAAQSLTTKRG